MGAAHIVLLVWLLGGIVAMGMAPSLGTLAHESVAVRVTTERLPRR